ncbi:hypothetical protein CTRI78_v005085 [Colletotrichum trifolii]|uniref:FAD-binding FR-type domain-containing protein n=1 Tax=Colletotrichum trifolii TaxID=5466 RepID=A0A4V3HWC3_COLTR|nr:hypothetical protein CTRI78_v005085 [Colletotrichum trifolii]
MPGTTIDWHEGELEVHGLLKVPTQRQNPTSAGLPASYGYRLAAAPLLALGTLDGEDRPWTTLWGGEAGGVMRPIAEGVLGVRTRGDVVDDPVIRALWGAEEGGELGEGEVVQPNGGEGKLVSGLGIDLITRDRVKFAGRMVAGAVTGLNGSGGGELQLAVRVDESLGNCPKYINKKDVREREEGVVKGGVERGLPLSLDAVGVVDGADMVFLSSGSGESMDTNHRGGSRGFVRVVKNDVGGVEIIYPEFSGNRLYQTLGNLQVNPRVGVAIPDFGTSDVLYVTGTASILVGEEASKYLPRTKLAIKITILASVFVKSGLPFKGPSLESSPYNPPVRHLHTEHQQPQPSETRATATLINREILTPTVARFTFGLEPAGKWEAGQYVTLDFAPELDSGWSHMRDDDPSSLNDDFVRTFTVSSTPGSGQKVEITVRKNGPVTGFLWKYNLRAPLEIPVLGFGGEEAFRLGKSGADEEVFVAAGVGITPVMAQAEEVLKSGEARLKLLWSVKGEDLKLVKNVLGRIPGLGGVASVFVTSSVADARDEVRISDIEALGASVRRRRIREDDVKDGAGVDEYDEFDDKQTQQLAERAPTWGTGSPKALA